MLGYGRPLALARWLWVVAALVVAMVIVGGITRLTESGLSITEWRPVSGAIPPLNEAEWQHQFALYKQTTQYQTVNRGMTLADFKFIFFWEWVHRLLGRVIGMAFALPLAWFAFRRAIPAGYGLRLVALLALGGLQGAVGFWMVQSGLVGRTEVSHYRLAIHLCLALFILAGTMWTAADLQALSRNDRARPARLNWRVAVPLLALAVQLTWGAFTAGLRAGYAFPTWPMMGDAFFPADVPMLSPWISNLFDNPVVVQFIHRWWAFVTAAALVWLGMKAFAFGQQQAGAQAKGVALNTLVALQVMLGIATLMTGVELWIAVAHQGVAALVVVASALCAHAVCASAHSGGAPA